MNREFVEQWVAALRSGEYDQCTDGGFAEPQYYDRTKGHVYDSYCCLGLGNTLLGSRVSDISRLTDEVPELFTVDFGTPARTKYDLNEQQSLFCHLTAMNDGVGAYRGDQRNFSQIADVIEVKLLKA